jgi:hypothetical protein
MFSLLFRNRWFAMGYVGITVASASLFVSQDGGADKLAETTKQVQVQRAMLSQPVIPSAAPRVEPSPSEPNPAILSNQASPAAALLRPLPGSNADPAHPQVGDVFINPLTGQRVRAMRPEDAAGYEPAFPEPQQTSPTP